MPRKKRPRPPAPAELDEIEFGRDPDPGELAMPTPPPLPAKAVPPPEPAPDSMIALGPPPQDSLEQAKWARTLLMIQARETVLDKSMSQERRYALLRAILRDAARHMTDAMRYDAKKIILDQRAELEARKRGRAQAKAEAMTAAANQAKIIPIRRNG